MNKLVKRILIVLVIVFIVALIVRPIVQKKIFADRIGTSKVLIALDANDDGLLDSDEIDAANVALLTLDSDSDGELSRAEMGGTNEFPSELRVDPLYRVIDVNGDSVLDGVEIGNASASVARLDFDQSGSIVHFELIGLDDAPAIVIGRMPPELIKQYLGIDERRVIDMMRSVVAKIVPSLYHGRQVEEPIFHGEDERQFSGYTLYTLSNVLYDIEVASETHLLNADGEIVHRWSNKLHSPMTASSYLLDNGLLLRSSSRRDWLDIRRPPRFPVATWDTIELVGKDSEVIWSFEYCEYNSHCMHQDMEWLPNGNILVMAYVAVNVEDAANLGLYNKFERETFWFERILELEPNLSDGSTEIVWQWDLTDHLVQNEVPLARKTYGVVSQNIGKIDVNYSQTQNNSQEGERIAHFNSISYNAEHDHILLSSVVMGEIYIIDHGITTQEAKGEKGDILYRWGNPDVYGYGTPADRIFYVQNDARWLTGLPSKGNISVFINGLDRPQPGQERTKSPITGPDGSMFGVGVGYSQVVDLKLPINADGSYSREEGQAFGPEQFSWEWVADGDNYSPFSGSASRLPNGNTLVAHSYRNVIIELTPEGEEVLKYRIDSPGQISRVYKFAADHPGIQAIIGD